MSKSDAFEGDVLALFLQGIAIPGLADNAAVPVAFLSVSAHTADPTEGGTQATNEATYSGYARTTVPRSPFSWTISGTAPKKASLNTAADWPQSLSSTSQTLTHFSLGMPGIGGTKILYVGTLTPNIVVTLGIVPQLQAGSYITED